MLRNEACIKLTILNWLHQDWKYFMSMLSKKVTLFKQQNSN